MTTLRFSISEDLCNHYGINKSTVFKLCAELGFAPNFLLKHLTSDQKAKYYKILRSYPHGSRVISFTKDCVRALIQKGCVRGLRLKRKLPVRGQRTRTNAKTIKRWKL